MIQHLHQFWEFFVPYLPLNIDTRDMAVLVAGGGAVAERKIKTLLDAGTTVRVVAPELTAGIMQLAEDGAICLEKKCYLPADLDNSFLVIAATNDPETNRRIAGDARRKGILVAVADDPKSGNCVFPAVLRRGDLEVTVSTNGACPGYAVHIRDLIADIFGEEYGQILSTLANDREKLLTEQRNSTYNKRILQSRIKELIAGHNIHKERVP